MSSTQHKTKKGSRESAALTPLKTASLLADLVLLDRESVRAFRKRWNRFYRRYSDEALLLRKDELRFLWHELAPRRSFRRMEDLFHHTEWTERFSRITTTQVHRIAAFDCRNSFARSGYVGNATACT